ncbi:hypothetical protein DENSPDRAFT_766865 [Dentipellis sp. KUC8613]|nr:hypothetical protein DENSPDRAFT_766865 [Dentipellis sp. KUC8613]
METFSPLVGGGIIASGLPVSPGLLPLVRVQQAASPSQPSAAGNPFADAAVRDAVLNYAYKLFEESTRSSTSGLSHVPRAAAISRNRSPDETFTAGLLPILSSLRLLHPAYSAILLLLGCVHFSLGDFEASLLVNRQISSTDPNYASVEALCNVGTTLRAMGRASDAYQSWWSALRLRPYYWVVVENLMALAMDAERLANNVSVNEEAFNLCQFVITSNVDTDGRLLTPVIAEELYHLQWVYYTNAKLLSMAEGGSSVSSLTGYSTAVELAIRPPHPYTDSESYHLIDLIVATCLVGLSMSLGRDQPFDQPIYDALVATHGEGIIRRLASPGVDVLQIVHACGKRLRDALLIEGRGTFPTVPLRPEEALRLPSILFPTSAGVLPAICSRTQGQRLDPPAKSVRQQSHLTTSTIILSLATRLQDSFIGRDLILDGSGTSIRCTPTLLLLLSYLGLALSPAPGTYNNLGIFLSSLSFTRMVTNLSGQREPLDGSAFAQLYYERGLLMDSTHPHLLTNLGSVLKDRGKISEAIHFYALAVQHKPDLDVALSNLATSLRDLGRPGDSIEYFKRALAAKPDFHEAVCGITTASNAICDWRNRGSINNEPAIDEHGNVVEAKMIPSNAGLLARAVKTTEQQLQYMCSKDIGIIRLLGDMDFWLRWVQKSQDELLTDKQIALWKVRLAAFFSDADRSTAGVNEGAFLIRFVEWLRRRMQYRWYKATYGNVVEASSPLPRPSADEADHYTWLALPSHMSAPSIPSLLPFHTFTYPLSPNIIRKISHRNALRFSFLTLTQPWVPRHVYPPPSPPVNGKLNIGYVSADLNDHPLAHLMESVFGMHDLNQFNIFVYATNGSDGSSHRRHIEEESQHFLDVSDWTTERIVEKIVQDQIHVLVNLGGYTKASRNDIFASCPAPVQMALMGFAGSLAAMWSDYLVCDPVSCLRESVAVERWREWRAQGKEAASSGWNGDGDLTAGPDPETSSDAWVYPEKMLYMPYSFMVTNHKQMFPEDTAEHSRFPPDILWLHEETRRTKLRERVFPDLPQGTIIFASFNQIIFAAWLRILVRVPNGVLWLLRFPAAGEEHLKRTARLWAGNEVASRVRFSDVAPKAEHIARGHIADLFLDTSECNAHTTAADALWSGLPFLTWPKYSYKMSSRIGASMAHATGFGDQLIVHSLAEYEERAVFLANSVSYTLEQIPDGDTVRRGHGALINLRRNLFLNRTAMPLFDTARWVRNIQKGYREAWRRWAMGTQFEQSVEWESCHGAEKDSGCIWVVDDDPVDVHRYD